MQSWIYCLCERLSTSPCSGGKYKYHWNAYELSKKSSSGRKRPVGGITKIVVFGPTLRQKNNSSAVAGHTGAKFTGRELVWAILDWTTEQREREREKLFSWLENANFWLPTPTTRLMPPAAGRPLSRFPQLLGGKRNFSLNTYEWIRSLHSPWMELNIYVYIKHGLILNTFFMLSQDKKTLFVQIVLLQQQNTARNAKCKRQLKEFKNLKV